MEKRQIQATKHKGDNTERTVSQSRDGDWQGLKKEPYYFNGKVTKKRINAGSQQEETRHSKPLKF